MCVVLAPYRVDGGRLRTLTLCLAIWNHTSPPPSSCGLGINCRYCSESLQQELYPQVEVTGSQCILQIGWSKCTPIAAMWSNFRVLYSHHKVCSIQPDNLAQFRAIAPSVSIIIEQEWTMVYAPTLENSYTYADRDIQIDWMIFMWDPECGDYILLQLAIYLHI
jgi:hypothetical protein